MCSFSWCKLYFGIISFCHGWLAVFFFCLFVCFSFILLHNIADSVTFILAHVQWGTHSTCLMWSYSSKRHRLHVLVYLSELTYHIVLPAYITFLGAFPTCDHCLPLIWQKQIYIFGCIFNMRLLPPTDLTKTKMPRWVYSYMI